MTHEMEKHEYLKEECVLPKKGRSYYKCKFCYFEYDRFSSFLKHILAAHKSDKGLLKEKIVPSDCKFGCPKCILAFVTPDVLNYHMFKQHGGVQPKSRHPDDKISYKSIKCDMCTSAFRLPRLSLRRSNAEESAYRTRIRAASAPTRDPCS